MGSACIVLTLSGDRISAMTRFENTVLPAFGLPRSLPADDRGIVVSMIRLSETEVRLSHDWSGVTQGGALTGQVPTFAADQRDRRRYPGSTQEHRSSVVRPFKQESPQQGRWCRLARLGM